jgi:tetratricopeptide (TPR) repeat protein
MERALRRVLLAAAIAAATALSNSQAAADDRDACFKESGDVAIAACTRRIEVLRAAAAGERGNLAIVHNSRGVEYANKRDYDRAIADFTEAIRINPKYAEAYNSRSATYLKKGEYDRAVADANEAMRLDRKAAFPYYNRGMALEAKGDLRAALADFKKFTALAPSDPDGPKAVARVAKALGGQ